MGISFGFLLILLLMGTKCKGAREITNGRTKEGTIHLADQYKGIEGYPVNKDDQHANVLRLHSMDSDDKEKDHHPSQEMAKLLHAHNPSSHMDHLDLSVIVFFTMNGLKVGNKLPIYFSRKNLSHSPHFLPREDASSIPFSHRQLQYLLQFFSFSNGSPQAKAMEDTLRQCEIKPIKGETKFCATSLESMLDFVSNILGLEMESQLQVLSTNHLTKSSTNNALLQNYTILHVPKEIPSPKMVACHPVPYPYAVFYCHSQETENKVFIVSMEGETNGDRVEALAVCHMDTSQWSRDHVSFKVLGIEPGSSHVCHFFLEDNLVFVPRII